MGGALIRFMNFTIQQLQAAALPAANESLHSFLIVPLSFLLLLHLPLFEYEREREKALDLAYLRSSILLSSISQECAVCSASPWRFGARFSLEYFSSSAILLLSLNVRAEFTSACTRSTGACCSSDRSFAWTSRKAKIKAAYYLRERELLLIMTNAL